MKALFLGYTQSGKSGIALLIFLHICFITNYHSNMKALFLGCHCDDIELGCGGTIHKKRNEWDITCVILSDRGPFKRLKELKKYSKQALQKLGVREVVFKKFPTNDFWIYRQKIWETLHELEETKQPDIVFTQTADDHQDHEVLHNETIRNFKKISVIQYQSSMRNSLKHQWNWFESLAQEDINKKIEALNEFTCYQNSKSYFKPKNIEAQARVNGMYIETEFAEAFELIKYVNK